MVRPGATASSAAGRSGVPAQPARWAPQTAPNPIAIVLPCHRVVGAMGTLVGYGGGLRRKALLLAHEQGERVFGGLGLASQ